MAIKVNNGNERKEEEKKRDRLACLTPTKRTDPPPQNRSLHLALPEVKRTNRFPTYSYGYPESRKRTNYENYIYRPTRLIFPIMVGKCTAVTLF